MFSKVIGLGQGGCRIANSFQKTFDTQALFLNFTNVDFSQFKGKGRKLVIETGGTGRDPAIGKKFAKRNKDTIEGFLVNNINEDEDICVCIGGGGGSGCGMSIVVLDCLLKLKAKVFVIYTLPEKREKLPAKPNALRVLNVLIGRYINTGKISMLLVDNEYSANMYDSDGYRFKGINKTIPKVLKRFFNITDPSNSKNIDFSDGYNSLDKNELKKVMFFSKGFTDVRIINLETSAVIKSDSVELKKTIRSSSLFTSSFKMSTSKIALVVIAIPDILKESKKTSMLIETLFKLISSMTKASYVFESSYYDNRIDKISINIMLGGLTNSKSLTTLINQAVKDKTAYENKGTIEKMDLSEI